MDAMRRGLMAGLIVAAVFGTARAQDAPVAVVASITILADLAREVGGARVSVVSLVPPDGDAHNFDPTAEDGRRVAAARLVVFNGLGLEGPRFGRLLRAAGGRAPVINAADGAALRAGGGHDHDHGGAFGREVVEPGRVADPHAWQDLANAPVYLRNIADGLARVDPGGAAIYRANAERAARRYGELDRWVRSRIAAVPPAQRRVITSHDAFSYFGAAYGVTFIAAQGISSEREATPGRVARLIQQARGENIRAIFVENMTNPRLVEQIARDIGAPLGGTLYSDALSPAGGPAPTYEAMFRHNVETLVAGMRRNAEAAR